MQQFRYVATTSRNGVLVLLGAATITVRYADSEIVAPLFADRDGITPKTNPFTSLTTSEIRFFAADGLYDVLIQRSGFADMLLEDVILEDPLDGASGERISVKHFGRAAFNNLVDYTDQVNDALASAIAKQKVAYLGAGAPHRVKATALVHTGGLRMMGDGAGFTFLDLIVDDDEDLASLKIIIAGASDVVTISGMTIRTNGQKGSVLHVQSTLTGFKNRNGRRLHTSDVEIKGIAKEHSFDDAMLIDNIQGSIHDNLWVIGKNGDTDSDVEAENVITPFGVRILGDEYPTDHRFTKATFYSQHTSVSVKGYAEGVTLTDAVAVAVGYLADWDLSASPASGRPGIKIVNPHVNSYYGVARVKSIQQFQFLDGEVYHCPGAAPTKGAGKAFTVNTGTDVINSAGHSMPNGTEFVFVGGVPPGGTARGTGYFVRDATTDTFKAAATEFGAAIDLSLAASGGCQIYQRNVWTAYDIENCVDGHVTGNQFFRFADFRGGIKGFTVDASTDVINSAAHNMVDGDPFELAGGAAPGGMAIETTYYARDCTTNTLKAALTRGGAAVNITSAAGVGCFLYCRNAAKSVAVKVRGSLTKGVHVRSNTFGSTDTRSEPASSLDVGIDMSGMEPGQVHVGLDNIFPGKFRVADILNVGNAQVRGTRGFRVTRSVAQTIPSAVMTTILWDSPGYDPMGLWAFGPSTYPSFMIPRNAGISRILVGATMQWAASNLGVVRRMDIQVNGVSVPSLINIVAAVQSTLVVTAQSISGQSIPVQGGDVISVAVFHDKGSDLDIAGGNAASLFFEVLG